ncbi:diguanylate cyclase domain-containing protein [Calothrix sp. PCC 7507]|uniref:GGDEF domain-containing response regulator n=1 Tax=Calothrix sp. PCC 7507 TaxID=99598 RepID=UPI00029ECB80|nr:diguanylate cyclase [Calothrix sp. PCC 7507]AFY32676.1 response regulator receiver modulated diguanylate cyclase with PAS/PAC sensor [Calothrix sp. PCC 7507]
MFAQKILVVEDEKVLSSDIRNSLQNLGYSVSETTDSGENAIKTIAETNPHLVLIDICLAGEINGIHVVDIIQNHFHIPVLYLTEYSEDIRLHKKRLSEPFSYVLKPCAERDLKFAIEMALYKHKITQKVQAEKQRLASIIHSMGCAVVVTSASGCIQMMNPIAETLTGWKQNEAYGKDLADVVSLVDKDLDEVMENLATQAIKTGRVLNLPDNCTLISKDGKKIPIGDCVAPIRDADGSISGAVLVFQDITQRKQTEAELLRHACYDTLTGLPNRVLFLDRLRQTIERSKRRNDYRYAVLFLDLDGFKGINDRFGHGIGDDFLVAIARRLELSLRSGDTVARFGGDEFALLLEDIKDVTDATNVAKRIQETLGLPLNLNGHQVFPTASIGIALSGRDYEEPQNLLRDADIAMYRAKRQGKARYGIFS